MVCTVMPPSDALPFGAIVCSRGQRPKKCTCCAVRSGTKLCDWKVGHGAGIQTCSKAACDQCATTVGPDKDLCREHAIRWGERLLLSVTVR